MTDGHASVNRVRGVDVFFGIACGTLILGCLGFLVANWLEPWVEMPNWYFETSFALGLVGAILIVPAIDLVGRDD